MLNLLTFFVSIGAFLKPLGYLGLFLISIVGCAILIPVPYEIFIFTAGAVLNPFFVGLVSGIGAAIGQSSNYIMGRGGRAIVKNKKWKKQFDRIERLFDKYGGFFVVFVFAATPLPDDPVHIMAGVLKYPTRKYFIASLIGKIIWHLVIAYAGFYGINWVLQLLAH